jgi:hypothetical protein
MSGDGALSERRFIVWFYWRVTNQRWSPLMHEKTIEFGLRIGSVRLGLSRTFKHFLDGKEPAVVPGTF